MLLTRESRWLRCARAVGVAAVVCALVVPVAGSAAPAPVSSEGRAAPHDPPAFVTSASEPAIAAEAAPIDAAPTIGAPRAARRGIPSFQVILLASAFLLLGLCVLPFRVEPRPRAIAARVGGAVAQRRDVLSAGGIAILAGMLLAMLLGSPS